MCRHFLAFSHTFGIALQVTIQCNPVSFGIKNMLIQLQQIHLRNQVSQPGIRIIPSTHFNNSNKDSSTNTNVFMLITAASQKALRYIINYFIVIVKNCLYHRFYYRIVFLNVSSTLKINMLGGYSPVHKPHCHCKYPCKQSKNKSL